MSRNLDPKRLARLERAYGKLLAAQDAKAPQTDGPEVHPCTYPSPSKQRAPCGRWLGTTETPDGWRCWNHGGKSPRLATRREAMRLLERLEPMLVGLLQWLDDHREPEPQIAPDGLVTGNAPAAEPDVIRIDTGHAPEPQP